MIRRTKSLLLNPVARRARAKQRVKEHGRHIYAYCHIQTKQVLYSLARVMNNSDMLKQFPDVGANNTPRALRKDVWRPFFILSMPDGKTGLAQGLMAFRQLREWRKLHEVSWEVSPLLARPHSEEEIKGMQDKLDNRGGSKAENVWDLIKRAKKKMRVHTVMDQKANSIADVATVLKDMDRSGSNVQRWNIKESKEDREKEVDKMLKLARRYEGGAGHKLAERVADLERQLEKPASELEGTSKTTLRSRLYQLKSLEKQMQFASAAVSQARNGESAPLLVETWRKNTEEETTKVQRRLKQLVKHLKSRFRTCERFRAARIRRTDAKVEMLQEQKESSEQSPPLSRREEIRRSVGNLANQMWSVYEAHGIVGLSSIQCANPWTLELVLQRTLPAAKGISRQVLELARDEINSERDHRESGWEIRVHELENSIHNATADIKAIATVSGAEFKIPEPNRESPPAELHLDAGEIQKGSSSPEHPPDSMQASPDVATEKVKPTPGVANAWHEFLPSFPPREMKDIPKRGILRSKIDRLSRPVFNTAGVTIRWENPLDAEYAESWPETVSHEPMGYARHIAPHAQTPSVQGVAELRAWKAERLAAAVKPKSSKQTYLEGLQTKILEQMKSKAFAEQDTADVRSESENRRLIKNVGLHKKAVKRRRARELEAATEENEKIEAPIEA